MDSAWVGLLGVVVGAGIGFGGNYLKLIHDENLVKRRLFIQKIELIYRLVGKYNNLNTSFHLKINHQLYDLNECKRIWNANNVDLAEVSLLINLYTPELKEVFDRYNDSVSNHTIAAIELNGAEETAREASKEKLEHAYDVLAGCFHDFQESIISLSKKYVVSF